LPTSVAPRATCKKKITARRYRGVATKLTPAARVRLTRRTSQAAAACSLRVQGDVLASSSNQGHDITQSVLASPPLHDASVMSLPQGPNPSPPPFLRPSLSMMSQCGGSRCGLTKQQGAVMVGGRRSAVVTTSTRHRRHRPPNGPCRSAGRVDVVDDRPCATLAGALTVGRATHSHSSLIPISTGGRGTTESPGCIWFLLRQCRGPHGGTDSD